MKGIIVCAAAAALLSGCAGRDAHPVETYTAYDKHLECDEISGEIRNNNNKVRRVAGELEDAKGGNVAVGVIGAVLFWPALFALDLSDAEETEMAAYRDRNDHLARLAGKKDCDLDFEAIQVDLETEEAADEAEQAERQASLARRDR